MAFRSCFPFRTASEAALGVLKARPTSLTSRRNPRPRSQGCCSTGLTKWKVIQWTQTARHWYAFSTRGISRISGASTRSRSESGLPIRSRMPGCRWAFRFKIPVAGTCRWGSASIPISVSACRPARHRHGVGQGPCRSVLGTGRRCGADRQTSCQRWCLRPAERQAIRRLGAGPCLHGLQKDAGGVSRCVIENRDTGHGMVMESDGQFRGVGRLYARKGRHLFRAVHLPDGCHQSGGERHPRRVVVLAPV